MSVSTIGLRNDARLRNRGFEGGDDAGEFGGASATLSAVSHCRKYDPVRKNIQPTARRPYRAFSYSSNDSFRVNATAA